MPVHHRNSSTRHRNDRSPEIRRLAKRILDRTGRSSKENHDEDKAPDFAPSTWPTGSSGIERPSVRGADLSIQPHRSGAWLQQHPSQEVQKQLQILDGLQRRADTPTITGKKGTEEPKRKDQDIAHRREPPAFGEPQPRDETGRENHNQAPRFHATLPKWGLGPQRNTAIYDFYKHLGHTLDHGTRLESERNASMLREVLEDDACARHNDGATFTRWINQGEIARGSFARVYLWEKQSLDGEPPLRMAVKDSATSNFWQDYHAEGALIKQLNESGCQNVITVLDWVYKPASATQKAFVRTCYEYAEHIDLSFIVHFYKHRQLLLPEAFIWHIFWSTASALCYCRHGSNTSGETRVGWDTIVHGDLKPGNLLLAAVDDNLNRLYPTIKLGDFGVAYSIPESNPKLRAWKSTFQYGTNGYWAPEVETVNSRSIGTFRPVPASRVHGSHSDIYSLGAVIESLMNLRFNALKDHPQFDNPQVINYYSPGLRNLVKACRKTAIHARPAIYDLYLQTCTAMNKWRDAAFTEADLIDEGRPFHSQVLFSKADQSHFDNDPAFRHAFRKANRAPLLAARISTEQHAPSVPPAAQQRTRKELSTRSTESLQNKVLTAWAAGDLPSPIDAPAHEEAPFTLSSALKPPFSAAKAPPSPSSKPSPTIFSSADQRVHAARQTSNLAPGAGSITERNISPSSAFGIPFAAPPLASPIITPTIPASPNHQISPSIHVPSTRDHHHHQHLTPTTPVFHPALVSPGSPSPSILVPSQAPQPPPVPTDTKPRSMSPPPSAAAGKKRQRAGNKQRTADEQQELEQQHQPKRKISRFVEHLEENAERVAAGRPPLRRSLRRMGALKGKSEGKDKKEEKRVRFDDEAEK